MLSARSRYLFRELFWGSLYLFVRIVSRFYEPVVTREVRGVKIRLNLSHSLPFLIRINKHHDRPLPAFAKFYRAFKEKLFIIDAGANVGDTALLIDAEAEAEILCIEASAKFYAILRSNIRDKENIHALRSYLGERDEESFLSVENDMGNAVALQSATANIFRSLDSLTQDEFSIFRHANIIKTDTEGFDCKILRGAEQLIRKNHPALFFEFLPYYLKQNAENIEEFFRFLAEHQYEEFLAYTQSGYPLGIFKTTDMGAVNGLVNFSLINIDTYFDILSLTKAESGLLHQFYQLEIGRFETYTW
ncbi:MAG: FkbM family methyltransferase [Desulfobulbaceae bacterium]|nr:FkbM family methyltransferase [Desulfobulbaceae bacterium]